MQLEVDINNNILDWIMAHSNVELLDAEWIERITQWEEGERRPTFNQVKVLSSKLRIPFGYFFLEKPPAEELNLLEYRTINSKDSVNPSRELVDTIHDMDMLQDWTKQELLSNNSIKLAFVGAFHRKQDYSELAKKVRELLSLELRWFEKSHNADESFKILRKKMDNLGVIVMMNGVVRNNNHRILLIEEFRAFTMVDDYAPLIFINGNDSHNGRLFSLIHEFAHVCIGRDSLFNDRSMLNADIKNIEVICNATAAEILIPNSVFLAKWQECVIRYNEIEDIVGHLDKYFKCGTTIVARRALDNGKISEQCYYKLAEEAIEAFKNYHKEKVGGGDFYRTAMSRIDGRVLSMIVNSVQIGSTTYTKAFRLTNTNHKTFKGLVVRLGGDLY